MKLNIPVQGIYQPARDLLHESLKACQAFEDKPLMARVLYLLSKLSYLEAQYGQAAILCLKAQVGKKAFINNYNVFVSKSSYRCR